MDKQSRSDVEEVVVEVDVLLYIKSERLLYFNCRVPLSVDFAQFLETSFSQYTAYHSCSHAYCICSGPTVVGELWPLYLKVCPPAARSPKF